MWSEHWSYEYIMDTSLVIQRFLQQQQIGDTDLIILAGFIKMIRAYLLFVGGIKPFYTN